MHSLTDFPASRPRHHASRTIAVEGPNISWMRDGLTMSRLGNVWDNAAMESFSSLKTERTARKVFRTREAARADVLNYI